MHAHERFVEDVLRVVEQIPAGRVMTYGDVAHAVGSRAPRKVGQVMSNYGKTVPWWRVVPVSGKPPKGHATLALPHYKSEGTPIAPAAPPEGYRLRLPLARLPFDHQVYEGALQLHLEQDQTDYIS